MNITLHNAYACGIVSVSLIVILLLFWLLLFCSVSQNSESFSDEKNEKNKINENALKTICLAVVEEPSNFVRDITMQLEYDHFGPIKYTVCKQQCIAHNEKTRSLQNCMAMCVCVSKQRACMQSADWCALYSYVCKCLRGECEWHFSENS